MKAAIYSRKSKFTGKGDSIENQIQLCMDYSKSIGIKEFLVYEDEGFSGGNIDRPQFKKMMQDAKDKKFDCLVCYRLDRISRNVSDFSTLIEKLNKLEISFISIKEQFDTSTPMGRAMMFISSVFAQLERETIAERIKDNMYSRVSTGKELTALASNSNLGLDYIEKQNLAKIWTFLRVGMGFTKNQAAGICGNFYNESKFSSDNAQEQKGGKYKNDHDSGYTFSTDDKVGYGIEQWTVPDVKKTLKNTAKEMGVNVSDINAQLATVRKEIEKTRINDWKAVISKTTYNEVSDAFLDNVEKPKQKNYAQRRAYSKKIYDALKNF